MKYFIRQYSPFWQILFLFMHTRDAAANETGAMWKGHLLLHVMGCMSREAVDPGQDNKYLLYVVAFKRNNAINYETEVCSL